MRLSSSSTTSSIKRRSSAASQGLLHQPVKKDNDDSSCASENSHPGLQLNIPHFKNPSQEVSKKSRSSSSRPRRGRRQRSSSPATISTSAQKVMQEEQDIASHEQAAMLRFLKRQQRQSQVRRNASMPETWSVKLPAYHQSNSAHQQDSVIPAPPSAPHSFPTGRQTRHHQTPKFPNHSSMFRGNPSGVSMAVAKSMMEQDDDWMAERREPFATIDEADQKRKWKRWFMN